MDHPDLIEQLKKKLSVIAFYPEGEQSITHDPTALLPVPQQIYDLLNNPLSRHHQNSSPNLVNSSPAVDSDWESDVDVSPHSRFTRHSNQIPRRPRRGTNSDASINHHHSFRNSSSQSLPSRDLNQQKVKHREHRSFRPHQYIPDDPQMRKHMSREQRSKSNRQQQRKHHSKSHPHRPQHRHQHQRSDQQQQQQQHRYTQPSHPPLSPLSHSPGSKVKSNSLRVPGSLSSESSSTIPVSNITDDDFPQNNTLSPTCTSLLEHSAFATSGPGSSAPQLTRPKSSMTGRANRLRSSHTDPSVSTMSQTYTSVRPSSSLPRLNAMYSDDFRRICELGGFTSSYTGPPSRKAHSSKQSRDVVNSNLSRNHTLLHADDDDEDEERDDVFYRDDDLNDDDDEEEEEEEEEEVTMLYYNPIKPRSPVLRRTHS